MSITKTLGGDRLGSGKRQRVELHNYERSTHNLGYVFRSTMSAGTLVPFLCEFGLPADTFDINLDVDLKTHPTIGPLFGSYKVQLDIFYAPVRLYNALLHNNELKIGNKISQVKLPKLELRARPAPDSLPSQAELDNFQINSSCVLSYLGINGVGITNLPDKRRQFNAVALLAMWEIYKNYYANKQEEIGAVIHNGTIDFPQNIVRVTNSSQIEIDRGPNNVPMLMAPREPITVQVQVPPPLQENQAESISFYTNYSAVPIPMTTLCDNILYRTQTWTGTIRAEFGDTLEISGWEYTAAPVLGNRPIRVQTFPLENIDTMRKRLLAFQSKVAPFVIDENTNLAPYSYLTQYGSDVSPIEMSQEGLPVKTYQSDIFNNWLSTEWIDGSEGINQLTAIDTSTGQFTLDTLNLSRKVYEMLNRIAVSGGSYDDWIDAVYVHDRYRKVESPMYVGGMSTELMFQEVVSQAETADQPLATLAGKGRIGDKKGGNIVIKCDEHCVILGFISLTPRIDYSQGNRWFNNLDTLDDFHKPQLDQIGFQELLTEQMAWWDVQWDGTEWVKRSAGKQPAWINYMTNHNRVHGNFANDSENHMVLNRNYESGPDGTGRPFSGIQDLTTYVDPAKFNNIFADTALDSQNFWAQVGVNMIARRKMSAKIMPNL